MVATRRTATAEVTEEAVTVATRSKRTRAAAAPRKTAPAKTPKAAKDAATTPTAVAATPAATTTITATTTASRATRSDAAAPTPAPSTTSKRRLRSTAEAASPLRALDEQPPPSKKTRTRKAQTPAATPAPKPATPKVDEEDEEDDEETPVFFSKRFAPIARDIQLSDLRDRNARLGAACDVLRGERDEARAQRDDALAELSRLRVRLSEMEMEHERARATTLENGHDHDHDMIDETDTPLPEFDSFDVDQSEPAKPAFMTGDESAMALLRHVQEAAKAPMPASHSSPKTEPKSPTSPVRSPVATPDKPSTPSRGLFSSLASPFSAFKSLFGASTSTPTPTPPTPTPSRGPPQGSVTEMLMMPPTPVGERSKHISKGPKKQSRMVRTLLRGIEPEDAEKATAWAKQVAAELQKDRTAGDKRKRLQAPVLFRDLKHFPSSKPWETGFSFPEDVLDLEDDDVVPAWAVYTSMLEEEQHVPKRTKTAHAATVDDDMPASLNQLFGTPTAPKLDFHPRRSIDPSPMFAPPLQHQEGVNVFKELHGHDAAANDRESLQRELKAGAIGSQSPMNSTNSKDSDGHHKVHDPVHGSFSVPDSDSEGEEEIQTQPVWTQPPPPTPSPAHQSLPNTKNDEEVERQRQKLMKHTPHKPSRLQQVSYPSPSLLSDAGDSPLKHVAMESPLKNILADSPQKDASADIFGDIPEAEPLNFDDDPELAAAMAHPSRAARVEAQLEQWKHWSMPTVTYDSDEEEISPV
ncbi:hypothetical protein E8E13_003211 [Curvularia kusanoi]|uniref:Uncharacterized protein n=1 Tax=Curvularia kusanoi TaxID=90978 RepID=A0A9P4T7R7_CURKU|nr:hypothetical protein E8E13_003211 [Curvularia kusanoi]